MHIEDFATYLRRRDRSEATVDAYCRDVAGFAAWFEQTNGEPMAPQRVTPLDVRDYKSYLQAVREFQPSTVNRKIAALRVFFTWARRQEMTSTDPTNGIGAVQEVSPAPRWMERVEQRNLARELEIACQVAGTGPARFRAYRDRAMLLLMLHAGLRVSEVSEARLKDLALNDRSGQIVVRATTGKGEKQRTVPLNASARKALSAWLEVRRERDARGPYLFPSQRAEQIGPAGIYRRVKHYAQRAGLKEVTPHTLRHTCAKNLVDRGVSLDRVAAILGHEELSTTAIYTQPSQADLAREVEKIAWEE